MMIYHVIHHVVESCGHYLNDLPQGNVHMIQPHDLSHDKSLFLFVRDIL